jgi:hypothetical protein
MVEGSEEQDSQSVERTGILTKQGNKGRGRERHVAWAWSIFGWEDSREVKCVLSMKRQSMDEGYLRRAYSSSSICGVHSEQGPRTARKTFSKYDQDHWRLRTDGDGVHMDDFVYRDPPDGNRSGYDVNGCPKVEMQNVRRVLAIRRYISHARRGELLCGGCSLGRSNEGRISAETYASRSSFGHSHGSKLRRLRRTHARVYEEEGQYEADVMDMGFYMYLYRSIKVKESIIFARSNLRLKRATEY